MIFVASKLFYRLARAVFPPAHQERIFQIFGRVHSENRYGGTGIGLSIVRKAVQRMNGEVGLRSQPGKGSCFWLTLGGVNT